jgi:predicted ester cyclase
MGTPATGKRVEIVTIGIGRFENGKVAEIWERGDSPLQQIGAVPTAASAG